MPSLYLLIGIIIVLAIMLMLRTSFLNKRVQELEDFTSTLVSEDRLGILMTTYLTNALEDDAKDT